MDNGFFEHLLHEFDTPLDNSVLIFSLILFIILLAPILLKVIRVPGIIGLILAGVIIGPYGLNILARNSAVNLFSTIGLLYIMFIAGLELDMNEFKKTKYKSLLFGFFTFIIPLAIGFPVCYYLLAYEADASFLTASMFATHTLVAYPIASKFGISKREEVAVTVGGTILTDTAVLVILAVIVGSSQGGLGQAFWIRLITSLAIFSAIMFLVIPRIAKWFFRKLESESTSHYIFVLSVVFFAAFLAEVAGVEPIIGAFVAGLALNRLIPHSSALMNRIEFIGNAIFIPFFLISVGMLVDVSVILSGPAALIVAATLTVVALAGKWIAAFLTQLVLKYTGVQRNLIFGLSSAHAAATLAVILVGYNAGILDENILNGTIILILATCVVASFVTEHAARKTVMAEDGSLPRATERGDLQEEHILLPVANTANIGKLLEFAVLIKDRKSPNPISLLSVVLNDSDAEANLQKARKELDQTVVMASATETDVSVIATIDYNVASGIARISKEIMADTIVLGWPKKPTILEKYIGEKTESLLESTDKNIFICHFEKPLVTHRAIVLICPPLAQKEKGFPVWLGKIFKLSQELSLTLTCHCNKRSEEAIRMLMAQSAVSADVRFMNFDAWEDYWVLSKHISVEDIIVSVAARRGSISYMSTLDRIPLKLEKHFYENSRIVIYPQSFEVDSLYEEYL
ncbi:cation:proton antiporter [Pontibacter pamirensis]|uniref:cation:proton antiporter n=1 Tax=Pontibacter pamirensis TaxID=2562824 RepID=UPI001389AFC3|nr:cation:proton antiporter [Pontibacter pamirensis]